MKEYQRKAFINIRSMNLAQQAKFLEHNGFASELSELGIGNQFNENEYYSYSIKIISPTVVQNLAIAKTNNLKSYTGLVYITKNEAGEDISMSMLCESRRPLKTAPRPPRMRGNEPHCPAGFKNLSPQPPINWQKIQAFFINTMTFFINTITPYLPYLKQKELEKEEVQEHQKKACRDIREMNINQQVYFRDNKCFTLNNNDLRISVPSETEYYSYSIKIISPTVVQNLAIPKINNLKSYIGFVYILEYPVYPQITKTIICESKQPSKAAPQPPQMKGNEPECPAGFDKI
ncbi:type IV pilin-like G/H family protein [Ancylothrix sp. C2]|uniref:type IV pilin-like G/H family protein n=1 Tax=Ancylothrix sp. D3o TaxID=2953691 RepID=UPI0021BB0C2A|nr:type IV pilin-like G/H family protein [Ancylothrix sp. D3o]MCT7949374.1 type IV pilin-like G/H family protein [Ancylothrix sp. D3o]